MSNRYKGGIISATPPTTSKASASGAWTLEQQMQAQGADAWPYAGPTYIEDVFSTRLYTGNGSTQTITNGVDLSSYGGLVWIKDRSAANSHVLHDSARGINNRLVTNNTNAQSDQGIVSVSAFNTTGFSIGTSALINTSAATLASWTFRKQPKFFDIATWTGNGTAGRTVSHNLGSVPGCMIIKSTNDSFTSWFVYHRSYGNGGGGYLNSTAAFFADSSMLNSTSPTSTVFTVGTAGETNQNGNTYVAYIFAHDAGGFGLTGTDNVISCGAFTTDGSGYADVNLGYEPQWILMKASSAGGAGENWITVDNMRGLLGTGTAYQAARLYPNLTNAEASVNTCQISSTGFRAFQSTSITYIYIAIRRGPMKVPTTGTSVFGMSARSGTGANATVTGGQTDDAVLVKNRGSAVASLFSSRLTSTGYLVTSSTAAEVAAGTTILQANPWDVMDGVKVGTTSTITNASANTYINYLFKRAPSFMDVVCYTGTSANRTVTHNLGVAPEMYIVKQRSGAANNWGVYTLALGPTKNINLEGTGAAYTDNTVWNATNPTASVFSLGTSGETNNSGQTYVAYLFATCAGVSKVGSYTGNGTTQTIDCGLTAGARFVLIKKTSATGDWYVYDTARGMTTLTDPYWLANSTAAEVATLGSVTTVATGFAVNSAILAAINTNAATYIFLAIA